MKDEEQTYEEAKEEYELSFIDEETTRAQYNIAMLRFEELWCDRD